MCRLKGLMHRTPALITTGTEHQPAPLSTERSIWMCSVDGTQASTQM